MVLRVAPQLFRTLLSFVLVFVISYLVHAQSAQPSPRKANKIGTAPTSEDVSKRQFAADRLESLASRAKLLDNNIMKVRVAARISDALWDYNQTSARQLFTFAFQSIDAIKLSPDDQRMAVAQKRGGEFGPLFDLRAFVLQLVARRDYNLAETLRKTSKREKDEKNEKDKEGLTPAEATQMNLDLAVSMARTQPAQAAQLMRGFISEGISEPVVHSLIRLRGENALLADGLFGEALRVATSRGSPAEELENLSYYVLPSEQDLFFGVNPSSDTTRVPAIRQFLDSLYFASGRLVSANALASSDNGGLNRDAAEHAYHVLKNALPLFERFQPERSATITTQIRSLLGFMEPQNANNAENPQTPSIDDLVERAESTVGDRRRTIAFMRASAAALNAGDIQKALGLAERIDDPYERKIQTSLIRYQAAMKELREGRIDQTYRYAKEIEFLPQRVAVFHRTAQRLWTNKEPDRARAMVEEIWDWLGKTDNTPQKADSMLKLTATMAQHDAERSFEFLQTTVRVLNSTDFSYKPRDPQKISVELQIAPDMLDFDSSFVLLARYDLDRARSMAEMLTTPHFALLAETVALQQLSTPR